MSLHSQMKNGKSTWEMYAASLFLFASHVSLHKGKKREAITCSAKSVLYVCESFPHSMCVSAPAIMIGKFRFTVENGNENGENILQPNTPQVVNIWQAMGSFA